MERKEISKKPTGKRSRSEMASANAAHRQPNPDESHRPSGDKKAEKGGRGKEKVSISDGPIPAGRKKRMELDYKREASRLSSMRCHERKLQEMEYLTEAQSQLKKRNGKLAEENATLRSIIKGVKNGKINIAHLQNLTSISPPAQASQQTPLVQHTHQLQAASERIHLLPLALQHQLVSTPSSQGYLQPPAIRDAQQLPPTFLHAAFPQTSTSQLHQPGLPIPSFYQTQLNLLQNSYAAAALLAPQRVLLQQPHPQASRPPLNAQQQLLSQLQPPISFPLNIPHQPSSAIAFVSDGGNENPGPGSDEDQDSKNKQPIE